MGLRHKEELKLSKSQRQSIRKINKLRFIEDVHALPHWAAVAYLAGQSTKISSIHWLAPEILRLFFRKAYLAGNGFHLSMTDIDIAMGWRSDYAIDKLTDLGLIEQFATPRRGRVWRINIKEIGAFVGPMPPTLLLQERNFIHIDFDSPAWGKSNWQPCLKGMLEIDPAFRATSCGKCPALKKCRKVIDSNAIYRRYDVVDFAKEFYVAHNNYADRMLAKRVERSFQNWLVVEDKKQERLVENINEIIASREPVTKASLDKVVKFHPKTKAERVQIHKLVNRLNALNQRIKADPGIRSRARISITQYVSAPQTLNQTQRIRESGINQLGIQGACGASPAFLGTEVQRDRTSNQNSFDGSTALKIEPTPIAELREATVFVNCPLFPIEERDNVVDFMKKKHGILADGYVKYRGLFPDKRGEAVKVRGFGEAKATNVIVIGNSLKLPEGTPIEIFEACVKYLDGKRPEAVDPRWCRKAGRALMDEKRARKTTIEQRLREILNGEDTTSLQLQTRRRTNSLRSSVTAEGRDLLAYVMCGLFLESRDDLRRAKQLDGYIGPYTQKLHDVGEKRGMHSMFREILDKDTELTTDLHEDTECFPFFQAVSLSSFYCRASWRDCVHLYMPGYSLRCDVAELKRVHSAWRSEFDSTAGVFLGPCADSFWRS